MLDSKVSLITGGTKGIGRAIAEDMLKNNMRVAITGRSEQSVNALVEELSEQYPDKIMGIAVDVRDMQAQKACVQKIIDKWGQLDVVIANAGLGYFTNIEDMTADQWNETIDVNLTGVFYSAKASIAELKKTKGYIITIASLAGTNFFENGTAYNASKFGLVGFTQAMMLDLRKYGIKVTTLMPGSVSTHFNNNEPSAKDDWKIQPEDLGQMVIDVLKLPARTLPSKIEIRPSIPPSARG